MNGWEQRVSFGILIGVYLHQFFFFLQHITVNFMFHLTKRITLSYIFMSTGKNTLVQNLILLFLSTDNTFVMFLMTLPNVLRIG